MRHDFKTWDDSAMLFDKLASGWWTVTDHDSDYVDLGGADIDRADPGEVVAKLTGMTSGGSATVLLALLDCDTATGTYAVLTPVQVTTAAVAFDNAMWNTVIRMPLPKYGVRRYLKLRVTIGTAALTAGTISAGVVK